VYAQAAHTLRPGDLLVLHTPRSAPEQDRARVTDRLLALAPRLADAPDAQACVRAVVEEFGESARTADACVLVARVTDGP
jgi:hypothetical protein